MDTNVKVQWLSCWKVKVDFAYIKSLIWFMVYILDMKWRHLKHWTENLSMNARAHFLSCCSYIYKFFFYKLLIHRGFNFTITQAHHLRFQGRIHHMGPQLCQLLNQKWLSYFKHACQFLLNTCLSETILGATPNHILLAYKYSNNTKNNWIRVVYLK